MSLPSQAALPMERRRLIEEAVLRTIAYADLFDYPLTGSEIARYLPGLTATRAEVDACLREPRFIAPQIAAVGPYFCRHGHEHLTEIRQERARASRRMWRRARLVARILATGPFIRMVAVTGALAVDNCRAKDDLDLLVVTVPGRVWLSRRLVLLISRLLPGKKLCPNFVLSEGALVLTDRNFYVAHELAQMVPLYGEDVYWQMRHVNDWMHDYLPNAFGLPRDEPFVRIGRAAHGFKRAAQWVAGRCGADRIERWELGRLLARVRASGHLGAPAVILDAHQCKAHVIDYPSLLLTRYREALALLGLDTELELERPARGTTTGQKAGRARTAVMH